MSTATKPDNVWKLAEAKNKLSEVVNRTISEGPQEIHRRDDVVVLVSRDEFDRLTGKSERPTFIEHLLAFPKEEPGEPSLTDIILQGREGESDK